MKTGITLAVDALGRVAGVTVAHQITVNQGQIYFTLVTTLTNGPVPDTKENRAKYGAPMSNAGKRTPAKGN